MKDGVLLLYRVSLPTVFDSCIVANSKQLYKRESGGYWLPCDISRRAGVRPNENMEATGCDGVYVLILTEHASGPR